MNTGHQSMSCAREPQSINVTSDTSFTGGQSNQQKQQEQPADASIAQMRQNIVTTTPPARQKTHSKQLQALPK
uniref:Uncharacterized protein n=1 Tax=Arundo donax TaxID=35708 RepID=A0A0A9H1F7_ARUDO